MDKVLIIVAAWTAMSNLVTILLFTSDSIAFIISLAMLADVISIARPASSLMLPLSTSLPVIILIATGISIITPAEAKLKNIRVI